MTNIEKRLLNKASRLRGKRNADLIATLRLAAAEIERLREARSLPILGRVSEDGTVVWNERSRETGN